LEQCKRCNNIKRARKCDFYYKDSTLGTPTIGVTASGYSQITQNDTIIAGSASKLLFTSNPQTIAVNTPSLPITFIISDPYGNATASANSQTVTLSATGSGEFSLDGINDWTDTLQITVDPPQNNR